MAIEIIDNFNVFVGRNIDNRYGPYADVSEANGAINPIFRFKGLTVLLTGSGTQIEYWYNPTTANGDLVPKGAAISVAGSNGQVVFYSGSSALSGSPSFTFNYTSSTPTFNVSGTISSSFGPDTVGFFGTASWALSASNAVLSQTSSFITASNVWGPFGSSSVASASFASSSTFALTASFITASNVFGPLGPNSVLFASGSTSASYALNSTNAATSSFVTASNMWGPFGSSSVLSASYASGSTSASYAVSSSISAYALGINLSIQDENITVKNSPTFINFTGSNIIATANGTGVDVLVDVSAAATASFTNLTTWNFTHNLKHKYVVIQALDTDHKQIIPESIQLIDTSSAILTFPTPESGYAIATIGGSLNEVANIFSSTSSIVGNNADKSFDIVHNFGTRDLHVTIYENSGNYETVYADILRPNVNTIRVNFAGATPPSSQQFVVYISR